MYGNNDESQRVEAGARGGAATTGHAGMIFSEHALLDARSREEGEAWI